MKNSNLINFAKQRLIPSFFLFKGRIGVYEYAGGCILMFIFIIITKSIPILNLLFIVSFIWTTLSLGAARCHDNGKSGWYQLVPIYSFYLLLIKHGEERDNEYGPSPSGENKII